MLVCCVSSPGEEESLDGESDFSVFLLFFKWQGKAGKNVRWSGGDDKLITVLHYADDTS